MQHGSSQRILLSGASGLIGHRLLLSLQAAGHEVVRLVRSPSQAAPDTVVWHPDTGTFQQEAFERFDAVIHLAGENVAAGRWTKKRKERLFLSRCRDSWLLSQILSRSLSPPQVVISASAIGFYGDRGEEPLTEESSQGEGFLPDLCAKWEGAMEAIQARGTRVMYARFGAVLSAQGGMLQKLLLPYKLGLGGKLGSGRQFISWIALEDVIGALHHILHTPSLSGPVNVVAPHPVRQSDFAKTLAKVLHRPAFMPIPAFLLRFLFGEMAQALFLASTRVSPQKLTQSGYCFLCPELEEALVLS